MQFAALVLVLYRKQKAIEEVPANQDASRRPRREHQVGAKAPFASVWRSAQFGASQRMSRRGSESDVRERQTDRQARENEGEETFA